jgi:hypothetical protein
VARELKSLLNYPELCQALIDNCSLWTDGDGKVMREAFMFEISRENQLSNGEALKIRLENPLRMTTNRRLSSIKLKCLHQQ